jgi:protein-S-isoprenylcysteine O-methyltransferase Ste14
MAIATTIPDRGSILAPAPVLLVLTFAAGVVLDRFERVEVLPRPLKFLLGGPSFAVGTALFVGAIRGMRAADTGPSHEDDPPELLTDGVFRYSRNPIYLGNRLQYTGLSFLYNSAWPVVVLTPLLVHFDRVIGREEDYLESTFGQEFKRYRETVPRWF